MKRRKELEKMLKQIGKIGTEFAEIRVTPETTHIRGNKPAVLALLTCLIGGLRFKSNGDFSEAELRFAIERGFNEKDFVDDEEDEEDEEGFDIGKATDELQGMLDQLKDLIKKDKED